MIISLLAAANGYSWADTLAHEFIHLVISKSRNKVPIWLMKASPSITNPVGGPNQDKHSPQLRKVVREAVRNGGLITFEQMHPQWPAAITRICSLGVCWFTTIEFLNLRHGAGAYQASGAPQ